jgi:hypothetical protein
MASDAQETLYRIFAGLADASGGGTGSRLGSGAGSESVTDGGSGLLSGLTGGAIGAAITTAVSEKKDGGGAGQIALNIVKSGLGTVPLIAALFGLFGGGDDDEAPTPLVKYAMPARREFQAAATEWGFAETDYDQSGAPRVYERRLSDRADLTSEAGRSAAGAAPQINVNVQAMDARSFLDRSSDIAAAVREAMLNLNSLNDVVTDL